MVETTHLTEDI